MKYLEQVTLQAIIYLLMFENKSLNLSYFNKNEIKKMTQDLFNNVALRESFIFKNQKNLLSFEIDKVKEFYDTECRNLSPEDFLKLLKSIADNDKDSIYRVIDIFWLSSFYPEIGKVLLLYLNQNEKYEIEDFISKYLEDFLNDILEGDFKYYNFYNNLRKVSDLLVDYQQRYKDWAFKISRVVPDGKSSYEILEEKVRLYDTILLLNHYRKIELNKCNFQKVTITEKNKESRLRYFLNIEIEVLEDPENYYDFFKELRTVDDFIYSLEYKDTQGRISILDVKSKKKTVVKNAMRKGSIQRIVFEYLYKNYNKLVLYKTLQNEVKEKTGEVLKQPLSKIIRKLGFLDNRLRDLFFVDFSEKSAKLIRDISNKELILKKIKPAQIKKSLHKIE